MKLIGIFLVLTIYINGQNIEVDEFTFAQKLYNEKFYDLAIKEFQKFVQKYPNSIQIPDAQFYLALSYEQSNKTKEALQIYRRFAIDYQSYKRSDEAIFKAAEIYESERNLNESAKMYETVYLLFPNSSLLVSGIYQGARIYGKLADFRKAEYLSRIIVEQYKESSLFVKAQIQLVSFLRQQSRFQEAHLLFDKIQAQKDDEFYYLFEKSQLALADSKEDDALTLLKALEKNESFEFYNQVIFTIAEIYFRNSQLEDAEIYFKRSLKLKKDPYASERLADIFYLQNKFQDAEKFYENSNGVISQFKRALALSKLKKFSEAEKLCEVILLKNTTVEDKILELVILSRAQFMRSAGNLVEIISFINNYYLKVSTQEIRFQLTMILGEVHNKRLESDLELSAYNRFILSEAKFPKNDILLYRKAQILEKSNKQIEAFALYKDLLIFYPNSQMRFDIESKIKNHSKRLQNEDQLIWLKFSRILTDMILNKDKSLLLMELAKIQLESQFQFSETIRLCDLAESLNSDSIFIIETRFLKAEAYFKQAELTNDSNAYGSAQENYIHVLKHSQDENRNAYAAKQSIYCNLNIIKNPNEKLNKAIKLWDAYLLTYTHSNFTDEILFELAEIYQEKKDLNQSNTYLKKIRDKSVLEKAYFNLAQNYMQMDSLLNASDNLKEILSQFPHSNRKFELLMNLRQIEKQLKRQDAFIYFSEILVKDFPQYDLDSIKTELISNYIEKNEFNKVASYFDEKEYHVNQNDIIIVKEFQLVSHEKLLQSAKYYDYQSKHQKSIRYYLDYMKYANNSLLNNQIFAAIADMYIEDQQLENALRYFEKISTKYDDYARIERILAYLYFQLADYKNALPYLNKTLKTVQVKDPNYQIYLRNILLSKIKVNEVQNIKKELENYKKLYEEDEESHALLIFEMALLERKNKNYNKSISLCDEILNDYEKTEWADNAFYYKGLNLIILNKIELGLNILTELPKNYPQSDILDDYYNSMGSIYVQFGKMDEAIEIYKKAIEIAKDNQSKKLGYSNLLSVYKRIGLWEPVLTTASTYVQLFPIAENIIDIKIMIGQSYAELNRGAEAIQYFKQLKLETSAEQEPEIQFQIAETYYRMKEYEAAISEFIKIPLLSKASNLNWIPSALYYAGQSYEKLGKTNEALKMYDEIVRRPGIDQLFKKEAKKRIDQLKNGNE